MVRGVGILLGLLACWMSTFATCSAQVMVQPNFKTLPLGSDTLCFTYRFVPNDTIDYFVEAADSIIFPGDPLVLRIRSEQIRFVCDSVTANGVYHLRTWMTSYHERSTAGSDSSERTAHPWVGREVHLGIDSLGHRYYGYSNVLNGVIAPGGAFQPLLLPPLDTSCGRQNQSWFYEDTLALVENGVPYPVMHVGYLWRVMDKADTLGTTFRQIQYTLSGVGSLEMNSKQTSFTLLCQSAGFGKLTFDPGLELPYAVFATAENKISLQYSNGIKKNGVHKSLMQAMIKVVHRQH